MDGWMDGWKVGIKLNKDGKPAQHQPVSIAAYLLKSVLRGKRKWKKS